MQDHSGEGNSDQVAAPVMDSHAANTFQWRAEDRLGGVINGQLSGASVESVTDQLHRWDLRVIDVTPVVAVDESSDARVTTKADFHAFNQQLAMMTESGVPIEEGLKLLASDMRRGKLRAGVERVAERLESGEEIRAAFEAEKNAFPPVYGQLMEAGVRSGNLAAVLFSLGRYVELKRKLSRSVLRAMTYPVIVLTVLLILTYIYGIAVVPGLAEVYKTFDIELPGITRWFFAFSDLSPLLLIIFAVVLVGLLIWGRMLAVGRMPRVMEVMTLRVPLIGPVVKTALITRWTDAASVGIGAGLALPEVMTMASDVTGWSLLKSDGRRIREQIEQGGENLSSMRMSVLPAAIPLVLSSQYGQEAMHQSLNELTQNYSELTEQRLAVVDVILQPLMLILLAGAFVIAVIAMLAPVPLLIESLMNY